MSRQRESGLALLAVLWLLLLLGVVIALVLHEVRGDRIGVADEIAGVQRRLIADAAINRTILQLINRQDGVRSRLDGFPTEVTVSGVPVRIRVLAEAGKIDLNAANVSMFAALLRSQGVASAEADVLADRIVAWRTPWPPDSIDVSDGPYRDSGRSYGPRHAPFRTVDEVRLIAGVSQALFTAIRPLVTVYSPKASVDRQTASDAVLGVLEESGDGLADRQIQARQAGNPSGIDRPLSVGEAVSIEASIAFENGETLRTAVVRLGGDARAPYWILDWR